ncbi:hypothetical protein [Plantactinospora sp. KBS50]|uniref:hypothetical protein n=1 Tax=Plantactinospora sp. KBS50 TaxID=2024580 RepID=UPI0018DF53C5|nr:hypothetical protein [Plantactinospora sp. KBS50]
MLVRRRQGVASLSITTSSKLAGEATYDYQRQQADPQYDRVIDLEAGDRAYLAAKDIRAEAVLISDQGAYTVTMSSFSFDLDRYERTLRAILDKILA